VDTHRGDTPRRVFALFDHRSDNSIYLDCVGADWFDDALPEQATFEAWVERSDDAPLHVLDLPFLSSWARMLLPNTRSPQPVDDKVDDDVGPSAWFEIGLNPVGDNARIYHGLFGEAQPVGVDYLMNVSGKTSARLNQAFHLKPFIVSPRAIRDAIADIQAPIEWVGVYDVGQGSANALCDSNAFPLVYFDVGGGALAHSSTFSSHFQDLCYTQDPKVILSHWDWDHWSSASRFPQTQTLTWIVPNQKLGAVHATMAAAVATQGRLLVWPQGLAGIRARQMTLEKCTGTSGRNSTGLALLVDGPKGELPILLTGDARYSAIPSGFADVTSVVVAHHGADIRAQATPICSGTPAARLAYSYGDPNHFGHPRACTYDRHEANGWHHRSHHGGRAIDLHTPQLRPNLGNIALGWSQRPIPRQPCGGSHCSLQLVQA
jgi:beta-lactamase superfamily II metal-dependent hydrolase